MTVFHHQFHDTVLREYDIRGIVGQTLQPEDAFAIGRCFGSIVVRAKGTHAGTKVAVGYDGRLSSPDLEPQLVAGLRACGIEVLRVGLVATPMLYYAGHALEADGAVMVTGSHNPPDYNGFKMMLGKKPFFGPQIQEIGRMAAEGDVVPVATEGSDRQLDITEDYAARVLRDYDGGERKLKVVWDPGNGSGSEITKLLAGRLPGEHFVLNGDVDGSFPNHHPDPTVAKNLEQLIAEVAREGADLGIAFDGDADRIGVVDDEGHILFGDQLLVILARDVLKAHPGAHHHRRRQGVPGAVRRGRQGRRQPADVEDRPLADQVQDGGNRQRRWPARCPAISSSPTSGTASTTRPIPRCGCSASWRGWTGRCPRCAPPCRR